jgi:organic hydroperoxide reductase OsmC/OhrA
MATTDATSTIVRGKEFHFPLSVEWIGGRGVAARAEGKPAIEITTPPVFRGTDPSLWSPEEFLVAAAGSCLAVTFTGLAAREGLAYTKLKVDWRRCRRQPRRRALRLPRLLLRLELDTDPTREAQARELAERAEETGLVSVSLDLPVETVIEVRTRPAS